MRRESVQFGLIATILVVAFLILTGFSFGGMPFNHDAQFSDAVTSHLPATIHFREALLDGQSLIWRDTIMAGQPFAANPLNKTAYPFQVIALLLPATVHLNAMIILHLLIAGWGMWSWTRILGLKSQAAFFAALAYMFAPRMIGHLGAGHLDIVYAMAWLPHLMGVVYAIFALKQPLYLRLGVIAALVILADVRVSLFAFALAGVYAVYCAVNAGGLRHIKLTGSALSAVTFACLTVALFAPLLLLSSYLSRGEISPQEAGVFSLEPLHLAATFFPNLVGNVEVLTYVGIIVFALAVLAIIKDFRRHWLWLVVLVFAIWYALGLNGLLWSTLTQLIPQLTWFRVPSRAWIVVALIIPLLAGYGVDQLVARVRVTQRWLVGGVLIALTLIELMLVGRGWLEWRGETDWLEPYAPLAVRLTELRADRIYAPAYSLPQNVAEQYHLRLFGGVDPFQIQLVSRAIMSAGGVVSDEYSVVMPPLNEIQGDVLATANQSAIPNPELLGAWQVSHVIAPYALEVDGLTLLERVNDVNIYQNERYHIPRDGIFPAWNLENLPNISADVTRINDLTAIFMMISWVGWGMLIIFTLGRFVSRSLLKRTS